TVCCMERCSMKNIWSPRLQSGVTKPGDYFLCYLTGVSRFIGILEVVEGAYKDKTPIWKDEDFPCRLKVKVVAELTPQTAVPVLELRDKLSFFQTLTSPQAWTGHFRASPVKWTSTDGEAVVQAVLEAVQNPITRLVDERKLKYRPKALKSKIGSVTVPESDEDVTDEEAAAETRKPREHTEIQWHLLKLGADMGFDIWVARNDRGKSWDGKNFSELPRLKGELPLQFDDATNRTVELIDVLWLKGNAIVAAFEVESTTSIYSGLLRMSDLLAMQPNLNIPLYLVAPDERREKVITEVNRPTFSRLSPPLAESCRFISFKTLKEQIKSVSHILRFLKPEFLEEISESCEIEEA
ncbi:MAG TPA: EVE domain-containing protein, partial [Syntrophorhabdaceae bacterium]|nr:EVE domain-containing protein [Syntrophorhabdaceae bacterium]